MIVTELKALTREKEREKDRPGLQGVVKTHEKERKYRIASPAYRVREYT